jgi:hypothetical protein
MAVTIVATSRFENANCRLTLSGLRAGVRYDVYRMYLNWDDDDDNYERFVPDRRVRWSVVSHRIGWEAKRSVHSFTDYEPPLRPFRYFVVETSKNAPFEWNWAKGNYPTSRGVFSPNVIHQRRELDALLYDDQLFFGNMRVRSTKQLGEFLDVCVYDMDDLKYTARGTEHAVIGKQFPLYVADTRDSRRGTVTIQTISLEDYEDLRDMVFPASGRISPLWLQTLKEDQWALLDDMLIIPLDITVQQASKFDTDRRYIIMDFVEIDPIQAQPLRVGDNDELITPPDAKFHISDRKIRRRQRTTLTDRSTGQIESWKWKISRAKKGKVNKRYRQGPIRPRWKKAGRYDVKLIVRGPGGVDTKTRRIRVR